MALFFWSIPGSFAAAVAADLLASVSFERHTHDFEAESLGRIMIEHGNLKAALEFVMGYNDASSFPFPVTNMLIDLVDLRDGLGLVRLAVASRCEAHGDRFVWLFQHRSKVLPDQEAREIVGEVVRVALDEPDKPMQATYDQEGTIKITSFREHSLFQVLHILRHFGSALAGIAAKFARAVRDSGPTLSIRRGIDHAGG